jgi:hypothetical protein
MSKKDTSGLIEFLLNNEDETEEDAREYLKQTGADPDEMVRKVLEQAKENSSCSGSGEKEQEKRQ